MKKKYIVWAALATIAGVGYYFWNKGKEERERRKQEKKDAENGTPSTDAGGQANNSNLNTGGQGSGSGIPAGLDVAAFQRWVWNRVEHTLSPVSNTEPKKYNSILCSGACDYETAVDGKWGKTGLSKTSLAWEKYKQYWDISKNQPTAEGDKKFPKGGDKDSGSGSGANNVTKAEFNKTQMDMAISSLSNLTGAKVYTESGGRRIKLWFIVPYKYRKYASDVILFENKSGSDGNTFRIYNGVDDKIVGNGYWSYNNDGTFGFRFTTGEFKGKTFRDKIGKILLKSIGWANDDIEFVKT